MNRPLLMRLLIIVAIALAFGRLGFHELTGWDDKYTISKNADFNPPSLRSIARYWTAIGERAPYGLYIPVTYSVWGVLATVARLDTPDSSGNYLNPFVFHLANVLLHISATLVVFEILRLIVPIPWAACAGALLWGLHPLQVEAVGWASGMKDVLCGLLSFVAIWQYLLFITATSNRRAVYYAVGTIALLAAMLSKPTAMVVPAIALTLDVLAMKRPLQRSLLSLLPWFAVAVPCMIWTKLSQITTGTPYVPPAYRPLIAADAIAYYLYKLLAPIHLGIDYGRRPLYVIDRGWVWFTWLAPAAASVLVLLGRRRIPLLVPAAIVFVIGVLPVLGFVPFLFQFFSTVADHYLYLSMLGPALALAAIAARWPGRPTTVACAALLLLLGGLSFHQGRTWRDDMTIFSNAISVNPRSFVGHHNLATAYLDQQRLDAAEQHFRRAIEILPDYASAHDGLAQILIFTGRREEGLVHIERVLQINEAMPPQMRPNLERTHTLLGVYLLRERRYDEAAEHFRAALRINPGNAEAQERLNETLARLDPATTQSR